MCLTLVHLKFPYMLSSSGCLACVVPLLLPKQRPPPVQSALHWWKIRPEALPRRRRILAGTVHVQRWALCACARASFFALCPMRRAAVRPVAAAQAGRLDLLRHAQERLKAWAPLLQRFLKSEDDQVRRRAPPGVMAACSGLCGPCQHLTRAPHPNPVPVPGVIASWPDMRAALPHASACYKDERGRSAQRAPL